MKIQTSATRIKKLYVYIVVMKVEHGIGLYKL